MSQNTSLAAFGGGTSADDEAEPPSRGERGTPRSLIQPVLEAYGGRLTMDVASGAEPIPIGETRYTEDDDGLSQPWYGDIWLNPPWSDYDQFAAKLDQHMQDGDIISAVAIIGALSLSADWFHDWIVPHLEALCVLDDRPSFTNTDSGADAPVVIAGVGDLPEELLDTFSSLGSTFEPVEADDQTTLSALTDGGTLCRSLKNSPNWQQRPPGGYETDQTWYLNRDRKEAVGMPHSKTQAQSH